jgi:hypothetical protein
VSCRVESLLAARYSLHLISRQTQVTLAFLHRSIVAYYHYTYLTSTTRLYAQHQHRPTPQPSSAIPGILPPFLEADALFSHPTADFVVRGWRQAPSYLLSPSLPPCRKPLRPGSRFDCCTPHANPPCQLPTTHHLDLRRELPL